MDRLDIRNITAHTALYGIIGKPVRHSLSPVMHNAAFNAIGIDAVYLAFETKDVKKALDAMKCLDIKGLSVTIPNKEGVIDYLDEIDNAVARIGACNTIKNSNGRLFGTNTDWLGAVEAIREKADLSGLKAVVLGAGGSSRAICYGLLKKGADVTICNRTLERAEKIATDFGCRARPLTDAANLRAGLLINTTSVGMSPNVDEMPIPEHAVKNFDIVMDIVYSPLETKLLKKAKEAGKKTISGIEMLLNQAAWQFEFWTGEKAPRDVMKEALYKTLNGNHA